MGMPENENKTPEQLSNQPTPVVVPTPASTDAAAPAEAMKGESTGSTPAVAPIIKQSPNKGKRISPLVLGIGCIGFVVLIVWALAGLLYYGAKNPGALSGIWFSAERSKTLLMIIAWVFFGILFFVSFGFLALNGYRLSKTKTWPKTKFIVGIIVSLLAFSITLVVWASMLVQIKNIKTEVINSSNLVVWYIWVTLSWSNQQIPVEIVDEGITPIAPVQVYMRPTQGMYDAMKAIYKNNSPIDYQLDCGNAGNGGDSTKKSQTLPSEDLKKGSLDSNKPLYFDGTCLYIYKGTYTTSVTFTYLDVTTQQTKTASIPVGTIDIKAEMILTNDGVRLSTNDKWNEVVAGDAPARIIFDAKKIFSDLSSNKLQFTDSNIIWDLNGDLVDDKTKENKVFFSNNYTAWQLYTVKYRLSGNPYYPLYYYSFPLRTFQSDVPICTISSDRNDDGWYTFNGVWPNGGTDIESLRFEVYNVSKEQVVQSVPVQKPQFTYIFPDNDQYIVRLVYNTLEKKKGFCESETINALSATYNIKTSLSWKKPWASSFSSFWTSGLMTINGSSLVASEAPFDLQVRIDWSTPSIPKDATVTVLLNDQLMEAVKSNTYTARVYGPKPQVVKIFVDDKKGNTTEKVWNISFNQDVLIGGLKADKTTGTDPLVVSFDASTISATVEGDEIVYYTRDFWDGQTKKNVTQAKLPHTYSFNTATSEWVYKPSVTVQTKKGHTKTFPLDTPIAVTRKSTQVSIISPSHPTQVATQWDNVQFTMQTDGYVTSIAWDFWDWSTPVQCDYRACAETKHIFTAPGTFSVRTTVQYQGLPESTNTIKIKVE
jgi:hypothetical protein